MYRKAPALLFDCNECIKYCLFKIPVIFNLRTMYVIPVLYDFRILFVLPGLTCVSGICLYIDGRMDNGENK